MHNLNNLNNSVIFDAFESSCIRIYNFSISNLFTILITSSMIYMFINLFLFFFLKNQLIFINYSNNFSFIFIKTAIYILYDVVNTYFSYKYNIFFLLISYIYIYIFLNNFIGLIPFSNTINNHFNITGMISFIC